MESSGRTVHKVTPVLRGIGLGFSAVLFVGSVALWIISVSSPKAVHWNRSADLDQVIFLVPHRIVFATLKFPSDPDSQTASRLRPPGFSSQDVEPRMYDNTFFWAYLGFQQSSGPYPQMIFVPATGRVLYFTLQHRALVIPLWIFPLLFALFPNLYLIAFLRRRSIRRQGLCPTCGYDLRAHQPGQQCPECGAAIAWRI